jgi:hypothetical protein
MVVNGSKKLLKVAPNFCCELCDYNTSKKSSYMKHLSTDKHKNSKMVVNGSEKLLKVAQYKCWCGKMYKYDTGYYRHKKSCFEPELCQNIIPEKDDPLDKDLIMMLVKQNSELLEVIKNGTNNTNTNNIINSHNKTFNLQFFLNETCKDAMNITDFVDSIKLQISDLEQVGELGYVEGISNIIVKNLKELDITQRPVHCTDKKRETVYIKDADKWEKDENKTHMHKLIKRVVSKNTKMFAKFKEAHPDCLTYHSKYSEQYNKIIYESMGGKGDDDYEKNEKIIKNVLKEVVVDKNI